MKPLQDQYNLIKEGKGHKDVFLKNIKRMFPNYIPNHFNYDQSIPVLKSKKIISEASESKTETKSIKDYMDSLKNASQIENNADNASGFYVGFYAEAQDPVNEKKSVEEIKALVIKNLKKDPLCYVKAGQFGDKRIGYKQLEHSKTDQMTPVEGYKEPKSSKTSLGDQETPKGMPKKIKTMTMEPQASKGIQKMPTPKTDWKKVKISLKEMLEVNNENRNTLDESSNKNNLKNFLEYCSDDQLIEVAEELNLDIDENNLEQLHKDIYEELEYMDSEDLDELYSKLMDKGIIDNNPDDLDESSNSSAISIITKFLKSPDSREDQVKTINDYLAKIGGIKSLNNSKAEKLANWVKQRQPENMLESEGYELSNKESLLNWLNNCSMNAMTDVSDYIGGIDFYGDIPNQIIAKVTNMSEESASRLYDNLLDQGIIDNDPGPQYDLPKYDTMVNNTDHLYDRDDRDDRVNPYYNDTDNKEWDGRQGSQLDESFESNSQEEELIELLGQERFDVEYEHLQDKSGDDHQRIIETLYDYYFLGGSDSDL